METGDWSKWDERVRYFDDRVRRVRLLQQLDLYKSNREKITDVGSCSHVSSLVTIMTIILCEQCSSVIQ